MSNEIPNDMILPDHWLGRVRFRLHEPVEYAGVHVPAGFITDGATTPRWIWWLFPFTGRYFLAAVVHDYLLQQDVIWPDANAHFYRALRQLGIRGWRIWMLFGAVSLYGKWRTWRS